MAILYSLPGVEVTILINGKPAQEYNVEDEVRVDQELDHNTAEYQAGVTVSKYIQSETNQRFSIHLSIGPPFIKGTFTPHIRLNCHIFVDGVNLADPWCSRLYFRQQPVNTVWNGEVKGVIDEDGENEQPFKFADITTNSDDVATAELKRLARRMRKVGVIEIRINSATAGKIGKYGDYRAETLALHGGSNVPETALKGDAKSHGTKLGKSRRVGFARKNLDNRDLAPDYPEAIFKFHYRDRESLKQLHIIERTPSQSPSSSRLASPEILESEHGVFLSPEPEAVPTLENLHKKVVKLSNQIQAATMKSTARNPSKRDLHPVQNAASRTSRKKEKGKQIRSKMAVRVKRERGLEENNREDAAKKQRIGPKEIIDLISPRSRVLLGCPQQDQLEEASFLEGVDRLRVLEPMMLMGVR